MQRKAEWKRLRVRDSSHWISKFIWGCVHNDLFGFVKAKKSTYKDEVRERGGFSLTKADTSF